MFEPQAKRVGTSTGPRSSVVIGGDSRPQERGAGPSSLATMRPAKTSLRGLPSDASSNASSQPSLGPHVVVDEHHQLAARALDARVAGDVQAERSLVRLIAGAEALHKGSHRIRGSCVVHDDQLGAGAARLVRDRAQRHLQIGGARTGWDEDRCRRGHDCQRV